MLASARRFAFRASAADLTSAEAPSHASMSSRRHRVSQASWSSYLQASWRCPNCAHAVPTRSWHAFSRYFFAWGALNSPTSPELYKSARVSQAAPIPASHAFCNGARACVRAAGSVDESKTVASWLQPIGSLKSQAFVYISRLRPCCAGSLLTASKSPASAQAFSSPLLQSRVVSCAKTRSAAARNSGRGDLASAFMAASNWLP